MFVVLLRFADNRALAAHKDAHKAWIQRGFDDGVFVLMGRLRPALGGALLAHCSTLKVPQARVTEDPFVMEGVVVPEILWIAATRSDARLRLLTDGSESTSA